MLKILKSKDFKMGYLFSILGLIASAFIAWYQVLVLSEEMKQQVVEKLGSLEALILVAAIQGAILTFIAAVIGLKLSRKVNLKLSFKIKSHDLRVSVFIGILVALFITGSDRLVFAKYLPTQITEYVFSPLYFVSGILYGGIVEEVLLRLFMMSLIVFILWKLFARSKNESEIPDLIYVTSIIISAALFAAGHLPITFQTLGNSTPIIIRCFILNGVGGLGFGYLYWKKGLSYSIIAHGVTHVFMQAVFMPIFF